MKREKTKKSKVFVSVYNEYIYTVYPVSKKSERTAAGYPEGRLSTDGSLILGDKKDKYVPEDMPDTPFPKGYGNKADYPNWPWLSHTEAIAFSRIKASKKGASDGFCWYEVP